MGSNKAINGTTLGKKLVSSSSVMLRFPWSVTRWGGIKFRTQKQTMCRN